MPLLIDFKSGDKLIINGAVIENGGASTKLLVHNQSAILREKEILSEADTQTPAARVYFALQCAYIFPAKRQDYLRLFENFLTDYLNACPSAKDIGAEIRKHVQAGNLYKGLRSAQKLLAHEREVIQALNKDLETLVTAEEEKRKSGEEKPGEAGGR